MAAIDQINVNIGTEQSPNYVLHDVNDKRISSTAVTTATHLLATDASLSAINPMTIANAASVLGVSQHLHILNRLKEGQDLNEIGTYDDAGITVGSVGNSLPQHCPGRWGVFLSFSPNDNQKAQKFLCADGTFVRTKDGASEWTDWVRTDNFGCNTPSALASLLGVVPCNNAGYITASDVDNLKKPGFYCHNTDIGNSSGFGFLLVIRVSDTNPYILQYDMGNTNVCIRMSGSGGDDWTTWRNL